MNEQKAVFLDRDGTINREVDVLRDVKQLRLLPGAAKAIREINRLGFLAIIVTNQPVIARGWLTPAQVEDIHKALLARIAARSGGKINAVYYCPHHPNANLKKYRIACRCRKPGTALIERAIKKFKISRKKSFMVGDHSRDILAGEKAKLRTILVKTGPGHREAVQETGPDFVADNLLAAVAVIKKHG